MFRYLFVFIFCCCPIYSFAQTTLSGEVTNESGEKLVGATIMVKDDGGYVQQYTTTSVKGTFELSIPDSLPVGKSFLEVSLIGYKKHNLAITTGKSFYNIVLKESVTILEEVKVKPRGIISIGDTLRYDVSSFATEEDRSVGDVIRRLPGVTVSDDGQIFFNGKAISNLFIHGDDLMDGRYGLATRSITKDMIQSVDILKNHQSIKVLKDRVPSEEVAMNLVLKDENSLKLSGQMDVGYGPVDLVDIGVTPLILNKRIKTLSSLKFNNIGNDLRGDLDQLGTATSGPNESGGLKTLLNKPGSIALDMPKQNYYFNNSGIFNTNNLYNLKNGWQLKNNIQLYLDKNSAGYSKSSKIYVEDATFDYNESTDVKNKPLNFQSSMTVTANKKSYFLENKLSYNYGSYISIDQSVFNQQEIGSRFHERKNEFLNSLFYIPQLRSKDILDFRWTTGYYNAPQSLVIDTGVNATFFNDGLAYQQLRQHALIPSFINQVSLSFRTKPEGIIRQNYEIAVFNEFKDFRSKISLLQSDRSEFSDFAGDKGNDLKWKQNRYQINPNFSMDKDSWLVTLSSPLVFRHIHYQQKDYGMDESKRDLIFLPKLNIRYRINAEDEIALSYNRSNDVGNLANIYRGILVQDYRSVTRNESKLFQSRMNTYRLNYKFQRSINMFFANISATFQQKSQNNIISQNFNETLEETSYFEEINEQQNWIYNLSLGKYIFPIASNLNIDVSYLTGKNQQYVNEQKTPFENRFLNIKGTVVTKPVDFLSFDMNVSYNKFWSRSMNRLTDYNINTSINNLNFTLNTGLSVFKGLLINNKIHHVKTDGQGGQNSSTFVDAIFRYSLKRRKTDINLSLINLMNVTDYKQYHVNANQLVYTDYNLRGRMVVLSTNFYF